MSDASQAPDESGTPEPQPAVAAPEAPSADTVDYAKRYEDARTELNRQATFLDRLRNGDPDAIAELGLEFYQEPEPEPDPSEYVDPTDALQARLDALEAQVQERFQQQQQQEIELASGAALRSMDGFESLPDEAQDWIWGRAQQIKPLPNGLYDVEGAWQQFDALNNALQQSWASSKPRGARVAGGQAATDVPPNEDASLAELTKWAQEQMQNRGE